MNNSLLRSALAVVITAIFVTPVVANRLDESVRLSAIARELATVRGLAEINAEASVNRDARLRFDYQYMLNALLFLERSANEHLSHRNTESVEQWDLNNREKISSGPSSLELSYKTPNYVPRLTEQEGLGAIASDIELVRTLVETSAELSKSELGRVHFDYAYMIEVLSYLEYAARAHLSLQNSQPRTQWDHARIKRFNASGQ